MSLAPKGGIDREVCAQTRSDVICEGYVAVEVTLPATGKFRVHPHRYTTSSTSNECRMSGTVLSVKI